ncbi:MAG: hypothetical protein SFW67_04885, partial [Myxococcaceae bacterium]|nr:hypothetical protein [Myxococcaceae bacterium]
GGLVVLGAAATAGLFNVEARRSFASAERMPDGTITGLTRPQAQALEATARTSGLLANIGFGVGGTLLIGAVVTWLVGLPPSVTVAMGPTGVLVASTFP